MQDLEQFKKVYQDYPMTYEKIIKILEIDKTNDHSKFFNDLMSDSNKLFEFSINNDIPEIVIFLYEYKNVSYNEKLLNPFSIINDERNELEIEKIIKRGEDKTKINGAKTGHLNRSVQYLDRMKKYSIRTFVKGLGGTYSLNPKYLSNENDQLNVVTDM